MSSWSHVDVYADDRELTIVDLAAALYRGELALFLGAGISRDFGLPTWPQLVRQCLDGVGLSSAKIVDDVGFEVLTQAMGIFRDHIGDDAKYHAEVKRHLYDHASRREEWQPSALLNSIGALLMGSRRGKIHDVWSLNYDDVLEWYLRLHGLVSQIIAEIPSLLRDVDVTIFHPHGFLPFDDAFYPASREIVFDDRSYAKRGVGKAQEWREAVQNALRSKIFLAIGLSWTDRLLGDLIMEASEANNDRPTAFWMFGHKGTDEEVQDCIRHNVVPLQFEKHSEFAPFIRQVCGAAMRKVAI